MTPSGTFVINGAERVVVSHTDLQGFLWTFHANGTKYSARVIPLKDLG
jgi:DNA-directed RNA polymerase subunit beta